MDITIISSLYKALKSSYENGWILNSAAQLCLYVLKVGSVMILVFIVANIERLCRLGVFCCVSILKQFYT